MKRHTPQHSVHAALVNALATASGLPPADVLAQLGRPPKPEMGDYAFPCFAIAKAAKQPPPAAAAQLAEKLKTDAALKDIVQEVSAAGPFVNLRVQPGALSASIAKLIRDAGENFGGSSEGAGKTIVIDYSGPNIAKPFHIGHLMTTVIGASLVRIYRALGYKVEGVNHLGDWGVQCGFQFLAWQRADPAEREKQLAARGLDYLAELYVAINQEAKANPQLDTQARELFKKLEAGNPELRQLFDRLRNDTLAYLQKIYDRMGIKFESSNGEAFYEPMLKPLVAELKASGVAVESQGAIVIPMDDGPPKPSKDPKPPFILLKSDEATIYGTRDLAAALYRKKTYDFHKNIYVVDMRQSNHFAQLFKALQKIGHPWAKDCVHVAFGMIQIKEGDEVMPMTTRGGSMIPLNELFDRMVGVVKSIVKEKNPDLPADKMDEVAEAVGVGAVVFWAQARRRMSNSVFDWKQATDPQGDTGPYLQFGHARAHSILRKAGATPEMLKNANVALLVEPEETGVAKVLEGFPDAVAAAAEDYEPSLISTYLLDLASAFGKFLNKHRVIDSPPELRAARLVLVDNVRQVLARGLGLLGVAAPQEM